VYTDGLSISACGESASSTMSPPVAMQPLPVASSPHAGVRSKLGMFQKLIDGDSVAAPAPAQAPRARPRWTVDGDDGDYERQFAVKTVVEDQDVTETSPTAEDSVVVPESAQSTDVELSTPQESADESPQVPKLKAGLKPIFGGADPSDELRRALARRAATD
jgi:hypothetical protein